MVTSARPFDYDKRRLRSQFERAAASYDSAAVLARKVADQLIERLDVVRAVPQRVLDAGCGTGYCTRALARRYRAAQVIGADIAFGMASEARRKAGWFARSRFVTGDVERLPFADASFGLVAANFTLMWSDPAVAFAELLRVLKPDGLLVFTTLGPDTLSELRDAWRAVDETTHVHAFLDMHDIGDALVHAGFTDPVMDVERYTLTYPDVPAVLRDLKALGMQNAAPARRRSLTGLNRFRRFQSAYETRADQGRVPATYEVVYGHAWAPAQRRIADGTVRIPVDRIGRRR